MTKKIKLGKTQKAVLESLLRTRNGVALDTFTGLRYHNAIKSLIDMELIELHTERLIAEEVNLSAPKYSYIVTVRFESGCIKLSATVQKGDFVCVLGRIISDTPGTIICKSFGGYPIEYPRHELYGRTIVRKWIADLVEREGK